MSVLPDTGGAGTNFGGTFSGNGGDGFGNLPAGSGAGTSEGGCPSIVQKAERSSGGKADIILIVDNSGSMSEEAAAIQKNLNSFSQLIEQSGIDVRVILIASAPRGASASTCVDPTGIACIFVPGLVTAETGICIDPPLGKQGACPVNDDSNPDTGYTHLRQVVNSNDALQVLQRTFNDWSGILRADAAKTFVIVSDDNAQGAPDAQQFQQWVDSQPVFQGATWRFSGIYCVTQGPNCFAAGTVYADLVSRTRGVTGDLAQFGSGNIDAQFKTVFDTLASAVVKDAVPVDCEWAIPPAPVGTEFDSSLLNVSYTNGAGVREQFYRVEDPTNTDRPNACSDTFGGWKYDNNTSPTRVVACPQTCSRIQADDAATIEVVFGCDPIRPPIQ